MIGLAQVLDRFGKQGDVVFEHADPDVARATQQAADSFGVVAVIEVETEAFGAFASAQCAPPLLGFAEGDVLGGLDSIAADVAQLAVDSAQVVVESQMGVGFVERRGGGAQALLAPRVASIFALRHRSELVEGFQGSALRTCLHGGLV